MMASGCQRGSCALKRAREEVTLFLAGQGTSGQPDKRCAAVPLAAHAHAPLRVDTGGGTKHGAERIVSCET